MSFLLIVDPSVRVAEVEGAQAMCAAWPGESHVLLPVLRGDDVNATPHHDVAGVVVMGSASSVYEGLAWQVALERWLTPIVRGAVEVPVLGICFGHQLLAKMGGGRVDFLTPEHDKRLGIETTVFTGSRLLPDDTRLRVVASHREHVVEAPPEYRVVAHRPGIPVDGLEHKSLPLFSVQFHPEAGPEFAEHAGMEEPVAEDVRADGMRVIEAFFIHIRERS